MKTIIVEFKSAIRSLNYINEHQKGGRDVQK
jgi:hypothetical protein